MPERNRPARETARNAAGVARGRAEVEAERGKDWSAEELRAWAGALGRAAGELGDGSGQARAVRRAASNLDGAARSIQTQSVADIMADLARFGRRSPVVLAGGAALAGFALSRFASASRPDHQRIEEERR